MVTNLLLTDEFSLINIDVPRPFTHPILALFTTCINVLNSWINHPFQELRTFVAQAIRSIPLLGYAVETACVHLKDTSLPQKNFISRSDDLRMSKEPRPGWSRFVSRARVIKPRGLSDQKSTLYNILIDCRESGREEGRFNILNILSSNDDQLIRSIRVYSKLKSQSFTGALRQLFSVYTPTLKLLVVKHDESGKAYRTARDCTDAMTKQRDFWSLPGNTSLRSLLVTSAYASMLFSHPEIGKSDDTWLWDAIPQRTIPLCESELSDELERGEICALVLGKSLNSNRIVIPCILFILVSFPRSLYAFVLSLSQMSRGMRKTLLLHWWYTFSFQVRLLFILSIGAGLAIKCRHSISLVFYRFCLRSFACQNPSAGIFRTIFNCGCGHQIVTERQTTVADQGMILNIHDLIASQHYGVEPKFGEEMDFEGKAIIEAAMTVPRDPSSSVQTGQETLRDSQETHSAASGREKTAKEISGALTSRLGFDHLPGTRAEQIFENRPLDRGPPCSRFLIVCYPTSKGRGIRQMIFRDQTDNPKDQMLINYIKEQYFHSRSVLILLKNLRGFSAIRLARFELAHTPTVEVPTDIEWKWPVRGNLDWEPVESLEPISEEGVSKLMLHIWTAKCARKPHLVKEQKRHRNIIPRFKIHWKDKSEMLPLGSIVDSAPLSSWLRLAVSVEIYFPDLKAPDKGKERKSDKGEEDGRERLEWLSTASLEADFGHNLDDPSYIYHRSPKKLRAPLSIDPEGKTARIGWGIWIDEDFAVPWYIPLVFTVISVGVFIFAAWYTAGQEPKANGWSIGSFLLTPVTLVFTAWVLKAKDSKHVRL